MWLGFALAWGTSHLFTARRYFGEPAADVDNEENTWGFGQWVPIVLLFLPILSVWESCYGKSSACIINLNARLECLLSLLTYFSPSDETYDGFLSVVSAEPFL